MDARTWFTPKQKAELWERWKSGQCVACIGTCQSNVRFTPESGHVRCTSLCPLCANSGHSSRCAYMRIRSVTNIVKRTGSTVLG